MKTWLPVLLLSLVFACKAVAVPMEGLYEAVVPVADTSEARRGQALARALETVLVRVAGGEDVLRQDGVDSVLGNARELVQSYQYQQAPGPEGQLQMTAAFGAVGVTRALAEIGIPVWGANRPLILAWVAVQSRGGRELATSEDSGEWARTMKAAAERKGLPLVLPDFGEQEQSVVGLSDIWGLFMAPIETASAGYRSDILGIARISDSGSGYRARWSLRGAGFALDGAVDGDSPAAVTDAVAGAWAEALAARYAVAPGADDTLQRVDIVIDGVKGLSDYAEIRRALDAMEPVSEAAPVRILEDSLRVRLAFNGELELLQEYLALEQRLKQRDKADIRPEGKGAGAASGQTATVGRQSAQPTAAARQSYADAVGVEQTGGARNEPEDLGFRPIPEPDQIALGTGGMISPQQREDEDNFKSLYPVLYFTWNP